MCKCVCIKQKTKAIIRIYQKKGKENSVIQMENRAREKRNSLKHIKLIVKQNNNMYIVE